MAERYQIAKDRPFTLLLEGHIVTEAVVIFDTELNEIVGVGLTYEKTVHLAHALNFSHKPSDYDYKFMPNA